MNLSPALPCDLLIHRAGDVVYDAAGLDAKDWNAA